MIYDRLMTVYSLSSDSSPLKRRLINPQQFLYGESEVFASRYFAAQQAGERIDRLVQLWRADISGGMYCIPEDGHVYRIVQAQHGLDRMGLEITTLSLRRMEDSYDIAGASGGA